MKAMTDDEAERAQRQRQADLEPLAAAAGHHYVKWTWALPSPGCSCGNDLRGYRSPDAWTSPWYLHMAEALADRTEEFEGSFGGSDTPSTED